MQKEIIIDQLAETISDWSKEKSKWLRMLNKEHGMLNSEVTEVQRSPFLVACPTGVSRRACSLFLPGRFRILNKEHRMLNAEVSQVHRSAFLVPCSLFLALFFTLSKISLCYQYSARSSFPVLSLRHRLE